MLEVPLALPISQGADYKWVVTGAGGGNRNHGDAANKGVIGLAMRRIGTKGAMHGFIAQNPAHGLRADENHTGIARDEVNRTQDREVAFKGLDRVTNFRRSNQRIGGDEH